MQLYHWNVISGASWLFWTKLKFQPAYITPGLFFELFEKTQGTFWTKNSSEWSQLRIWAKKTQGKLTLMGSFLKEWQDFDHFYYQIDHIWANIAFISCKTNHLKKTQGFRQKKVNPSASSDSVKLQKSRSKNKPVLPALTHNAVLWLRAGR